MWKSSRTRHIVLTLLLMVGAPSVTYAQASIAGVVRDTSGAVLPGVTVEATSPALIERLRSVVTDGAGQYRIIDLRPGAYTITFTLPGFSTVKRDGIELTGTFTATVNAELRVGALEETITVTSDSPIVDVQSATRQRVFDAEVVATIPTGRALVGLVALIPGVVVEGGGRAADVGGSQGGTPLQFSVHGSNVADSRITLNGVVLSTRTVGTSSLLVPNLNAAQETTVDTGAASAELAVGGPRINVIPRDGGNTFKGSAFGTFTNGSLQGNNFTQRVRDRGLTTPDSIKALWDVNPGFGGPIEQDRLWFYTTVRHYGANLYAGGAFYDLNASNPNAFTYQPDTTRPAYNDQTWRDAQGRLTWQATPRNKLAGSWDQQTMCRCPALAGSNTSTGGTVTTVTFRAPEAGANIPANPQRVLQGEWTSPVTNRLLLEAVVINPRQTWRFDPSSSLSEGKISITDQSTSLTYRAAPTYPGEKGNSYWYRASVAYVTGSHAVKVGFNNAYITSDADTRTTFPLNYQVNTVNGVTTPNRITLHDTPFVRTDHVDADLGVYAQDRWTLKRLTLTGGLRFDYFRTSSPDQTLGPTILLPTQNVTLRGVRPDLLWKDITPRTGATYDVFGDGRTAVKVSLNKYLTSPTLIGLRNPLSTFVLNTTRSWNDSFHAAGDSRRQNWVPDCDLLNPVANGECGAMANSAFGRFNTLTTTFDPNLYSGWGNRTYNWEFSAGVQHALASRVSMDVGFFRRWFGNFQATDNLAVTPGDFSPYGVTAPIDSRLPGGGGNQIAGFVDLNPNKVGQVQNHRTLSGKYGKQIEHWNGADIGINARPGEGVFLQGGLSTGRTVTDNCEILAELPEMAPAGRPYCHVETKFLTQVKLLGSYVIPRIDVQVSSTYQSLPGPQIGAVYNAPNAVVAPSLGRPLSGGAANATVQLLAPGTKYGERMNQLDLRLGKLVRFGRTRTTVSVDVYNVLNDDAIVGLSDAFAIWQQAQKIQLARFVKFSANIEF